MRTAAAIALVLLPAITAAAPLSFSWQGRLLDAAGGPLEGEHTLDVTLYSSTDSAVWQNTFTAVPFEAGYFTVTLDTDATGRTLDSAMVGLNAATALGFGIDGAGELAPRQAFDAVPHAAVASSVPASANLIGASCPGLGAVGFDVALDTLVVCGASGLWDAVSIVCPTGETLVGTECTPCGADAISDAGPLYFWSLDDGDSSTATDETGRKNGTYFGPITRSSDTPVVGSQGITLPSATSTYIQATSFNPPQGDSTTMAWIKTTTVDSSVLSYAISGSFNEWLPIYRPFSFTYLVQNDAGDSTVSANDGEWHHIAMSRVESTGEVTVFIDGVQQGTAIVTPGLSPRTGGNLVIGQEQDTVGGGFQGSQSFVGSLDDIAIFTRTMDADQIERIYRGQTCQ